MVNGIYMLVGVSLGEGFGHVVKKSTELTGWGDVFYCVTILTQTWLCGHPLVFSALNDYTG